jgi:uncharacterized protein (DUF952 family)
LIIFGISVGHLSSFGKSIGKKHIPEAYSANTIVVAIHNCSCTPDGVAVTGQISDRKPDMTLIYKISPRSAWDAATDKGIFLGAPVDLADGYIHFSSASQMRETAAKHFAGQQDLVLAVIDTVSLGENLKWEPSRGGALFPHLYGPLLMEAVVGVHDLPVGSDGLHVFPETVR